MRLSLYYTNGKKMQNLTTPTETTDLKLNQQVIWDDGDKCKVYSIKGGEVELYFPSGMSIFYTIETLNRYIATGRITYN